MRRLVVIYTHLYATEQNYTAKGLSFMSESVVHRKNLPMNFPEERGIDTQGRPRLEMPTALTSLLCSPGRTMG